MRLIPTSAIALALLVSACAASAALIQPDSAAANNEFNNTTFGIGNTIDGSGLPPNFTPLSPHDDYTFSNHWTTNGNPAVGFIATFTFDVPQPLGAFYMWNHQSTTPFAQDSNYYVTNFDLILRDAGDLPLLTLPNLSAGASATAQTYAFGPVTGVKSVQFVINANAGSQYTGLAEVAFEQVPEPATATLMLAGVLAVMRRNRRA